MAPPRQRAPPNLDDSRSEASSGTREHKGAGAKSRKPANVSTAAVSLAAKDLKVPPAIATATSLPGSDEAAAPPEELPSVSFFFSFLAIEPLQKICLLVYGFHLHYEISSFPLVSLCD